VTPDDAAREEASERARRNAWALYVLDAGLVAKETARDLSFFNAGWFAALRTRAAPTVEATPPARCPTCGGTRPAARFHSTRFDADAGQQVTHFDTEPFEFAGYCRSVECPDAFHAPPAPPACRDVPASSTFRFDPATPPAPVVASSAPSAGAVEGASMEALDFARIEGRREWGDEGLDPEDIERIARLLTAFAASRATGEGDRAAALREAAALCEPPHANASGNGPDGCPHSCSLCGHYREMRDAILARLDARLAARDESTKETT
jgi:hypothetical protein